MPINPNIWIASQPIEASRYSDLTEAQTQNALADVRYKDAQILETLRKQEADRAWRQQQEEYHQRMMGGQPGMPPAPAVTQGIASGGGGRNQQLGPGGLPVGSGTVLLPGAGRGQPAAPRGAPGAAQAVSGGVDYSRPAYLQEGYPRGSLTDFYRSPRGQRIYQNAYHGANSANEAAAAGNKAVRDAYEAWRATPTTEVGKAFMAYKERGGPLPYDQWLYQHQAGISAAGKNQKEDPVGEWKLKRAFNYFEETEKALTENQTQGQRAEAAFDTVIRLGDVQGEAMIGFRDKMSALASTFDIDKEWLNGLFDDVGLGKNFVFNEKTRQELAVMRRETMYQVLKHIADTKGAISEREMAAFRAASVNEDNVMMANAILMDGLITAHSREVERAEHYNKLLDRYLSDKDLPDSEAYKRAMDETIKWADAQHKTGKWSENVDRLNNLVNLMSPDSQINRVTREGYTLNGEVTRAAYEPMHVSGADDTGGSWTRDLYIEGVRAAEATKEYREFAGSKAVEGFDWPRYVPGQARHISEPMTAMIMRVELGYLPSTMVRGHVSRTEDLLDSSVGVRQWTGDGWQLMYPPKGFTWRNYLGKALEEQRRYVSDGDILRASPLGLIMAPDKPNLWDTE